MTETDHLYETNWFADVCWTNNYVSKEAGYVMHGYDEDRDQTCCGQEVQEVKDGQFHTDTIGCGRCRRTRLFKQWQLKEAAKVQSSDAQLPGQPGQNADQAAISA